MLITFVFKGRVGGCGFSESRVLYICVSCWLLAHESRDLSQDETKITVARAEQIHKMLITSALATIIFFSA